MKKLNNYLIGNRQLTVDCVMKVSRVLGMLFSLVELFVRRWVLANVAPRLIADWTSLRRLLIDLTKLYSPRSDIRSWTSLGIAFVLVMNF